MLGGVIKHALRLRPVSESETKRIASGRSRFMASNTPLKSSGSRTPSACTVAPIERAELAETS